MIPTGSNQEIRGLAPSCIVFLPRICCKMHISRSFPCERACSNDDHALKRVFLYLHVFSEIWFSKFFKILEVKKGISQEQRKLLGNFPSFVCSFNIFFFFFFSFEGHPPLYFAFIRIKRKIFRNKGRSSFPWKWKFVCTFPMNPRILWIKNIWKDYPSNCTIDSMLNDKIEYNSSLFRYFIYRSFRREKWLEYISVYKTTRVHRISNRIYPFPVTNNRDNINARNFSLFRLIHEKPIRFPDLPRACFSNTVYTDSRISPRGGFRPMKFHLEFQYRRVYRIVAQLWKRLERCPVLLWGFDFLSFLFIPTPSTSLLLSPSEADFADRL